MHFNTVAALALCLSLPLTSAIPLWQAAAGPAQPQRVPPRPHYRNNRIGNGDNGGPAIVANINYNVPAMTAGVGHATGTLVSGILVPTGATGMVRGTGAAAASGAAIATGTAAARGTGAPLFKRSFIGGTAGWNGTAAAQHPLATGTGAGATAPALVTGTHPQGTGLPVHEAALRRRFLNSTENGVSLSGAGPRPTGAAHGNQTATIAQPSASAASMRVTRQSEQMEHIESRGDESCEAGEIRCDSLSSFSHCRKGGLFGTGKSMSWVNGGRVEAGHVCMNGKIQEISLRSGDERCSMEAEGAILCAEEGAMYGDCSGGKLSALKVVKKGHWCIKGRLVELGAEESTEG